LLPPVMWCTRDGDDDDASEEGEAFQERECGDASPLASCSPSCRRASDDSDPEEDEVHSPVRQMDVPMDHSDVVSISNEHTAVNGLKCMLPPAARLTTTAQKVSQSPTSLLTTYMPQPNAGYTSSPSQGSLRSQSAQASQALARSERAAPTSVNIQASQAPARSERAAPTSANIKAPPASSQTKDLRATASLTTTVLPRPMQEALPTSVLPPQPSEVGPRYQEVSAANPTNEALGSMGALPTFDGMPLGSMGALPTFDAAPMSASSALPTATFGEAPLCTSPLATSPLATANFGQVPATGAALGTSPLPTATFGGSLALPLGTTPLATFG